MNNVFCGLITRSSTGLVTSKSKRTRFSQLETGVLLIAARSQRDTLAKS